MNYRLRSKAYLKSIRGKPCLACGFPGEAHHLTFMQPRALALKTGDQFCVPLCHSCHMDLHVSPMPEKTWWALKGIDARIWAINHYEKWKKRYGDTENGNHTDTCPREPEPEEDGLAEGDDRSLVGIQDREGHD